MEIQNIKVGANPLDNYGCTQVDLGRAYRRSYNMIFFTSLESNVLQTPTYIANTQSGYINQIALINADTSINNPLTIHRLRLLSNMDALIGSKNILLKKITFRAFLPNTNMTTTNGTITPTTATSGIVTATTGTHTSANPALSANYSIADNTTGSVQNPTSNVAQSTVSPYGYTEIMNWQPNYFRPSLIINNEDYFNGSSVANLGDMSIGLPLPLIIEPYVPYDQITNLTVSARAGIYNPTTTEIQRVCVYCNLEFSGS